MSYPEYIPYRRKPQRTWVFLIVVVSIVLAGLLVLQIPRINRAVTWRLDIVLTYLRMALNPVSKLPTPMTSQNLPQVETSPIVVRPTVTQNAIQATVAPTLHPTPTIKPTPLPESALLTPPAYNPTKDKQDWNNCGPATLALYLRFYGWSGNQYDISTVIKPTRDDRNVNVEELVYYVRTQAGWLNAEYRVGGTIDTLRKFLANGIPVMIEETFTTDRKYWPDDDRWAGHYLLISGYDDRVRQFTAQDSEIGPDQKIVYDVLEDNWQSFNYVYILVFKPEQIDLVNSLLGPEVDVDVNRQYALNSAEKETQTNPQNAYAWFNYGSNLVYFERYHEAALAYDKARSIGLPERMLRYQFGPFIAYFHAQRTDELMALTKYALGITRTSEEAMLWRGWGFYRMGDSSTAANYFRDALKIHPGYDDAQYALDYVNSN